MTVRHRITTALALAAVLFAAGCGRGDGPALVAEVEDPLYQQGQLLKRQGRNPEALVSFIKVIEKRGQQSAAESHLEAGQIYLYHSKDFIEAIHHFEAYLALQPNSREARHVRELINTAKREFARTLPARPAEDRGFNETAVEMDQLRRENEELRAQVATLRGGGGAPVPRTPRGVSVVIPEPVRSAPAPAPASVEESPLSLAPAPRAVAPDRQLLPSAPASVRAKPTTPAVSGGRKYRVRPGDSLFAIARQYDPVSTSKKVREIAEANPEVFISGNINIPLKQGTELRIP